jgi:hypothetical protein
MRAHLSNWLGATLVYKPRRLGRSPVHMLLAMTKSVGTIMPS